MEVVLFSLFVAVAITDGCCMWFVLRRSGKMRLRLPLLLLASPWTLIVVVACIWPVNPDERTQALEIFAAGALGPRLLGTLAAIASREESAQLMSVGLTALGMLPGMFFCLLYLLFTT